ncbi:MAG: FixH family protein [Sediminibacterium sp.]|nr:FixH family protein [Sediminibacterium sp.]
MNFGVKITILYLSFVALILTLVFLCHGQKVELVSKDYYAQELAFQNRIDAIKNEKALTNSIRHEINGRNIILMMDSTIQTPDFKGTVNFFRPSDSSKDVQLNLNFNNGTQIIDGSQLIKGAYKLQLSWKSNGIDYFKETVINIP